MQAGKSWGYLRNRKRLQSVEHRGAWRKRDEMCRRKRQDPGCRALQGRRKALDFIANALGRSGVIMLHYI